MPPCAPLPWKGTIGIGHATERRNAKPTLAQSMMHRPWKLRPNRVRGSRPETPASAHKAKPDGGRRWGTLTTAVLAILTLVVLIMQTQIMRGQQDLMAQQSVVSASDRLEKLADHQLEVRLLTHRIKAFINPTPVPVWNRTCATVSRCETDVRQVVQSMKMTPRQTALGDSKAIDEYPTWTTAKWTAQSLDLHEWSARILFGPAFESPHATAAKQSQTLIDGVVEPAIAKCGFSHAGGRELLLAMDTLATLAQANAAAPRMRKPAVIRALQKLRRNFGDGAEGLDLFAAEPYPVKTYILQMRRMYLAMDWVPTALLRQCEREEARVTAEYAHIAEQTSNATGIHTEASVADCKENKCGGPGGVMMFWKPVDGWRQMHDPRDVEEAKELAARAERAASATTGSASHTHPSRVDVSRSSESAFAPTPSWAASAGSHMRRPVETAR